MALVIALAVNNGFKNTLERNLLGAMAHINVMEKEPLYGIENWRGHGRAAAQGAARDRRGAGDLHPGVAGGRPAAQVRACSREWTWTPKWP